MGFGTNAASFTQPRHARQEPVGAFDVFHRNDVAIDHDRGLSDIERTERTEHVASPGDVGDSACRWCRAGNGPLRHQQIGRDVLDPDHAKTLRFEDAANAG